MEYTGSNLREIMKLTLNLDEHIFDNIGKVLAINAVDGFTYSTFTNSGYLDLNEPEKRFLVKKDFFRVYNQAEQYEMQFGLFKYNKLEILQSPINMFQKHSWLLERMKFIVFLEYSTKINSNEPPYYKGLKDLNKKIIDLGMDPHDFIITLVNSDRAMELESFFEYLISEIYKRKGYFTDNQLPFYYGIGTPDIAAYSLNELSRLTDAYFGIKSCSIIEIAYLNYLNKSDNPTNEASDRDIVFEVKTSSLDGSQIKKYLSKNIFDEAYEVIPHKTKKSSYAGLIKIDDNKLLIDKLDKVMSIVNKGDYKSWLSNYIKVLVLANLNNSQISDFCKNKNIITQYELISFLEKTSMNDLFGMVFKKGE